MDATIRYYSNNQLYFVLKGASINYLGEVRLLITGYKPKAQYRDAQTSENCDPKERDIYTEFIEPTYGENFS